jgi:glycosyltransferase involved in cell wall biosynthesis
LEAMAVGLPVVGTSISFQGTQAKETDGIRIADDPKMFAQEILTLLQNQGLRHQCSLNVRTYVERCHRWEDHCLRLESLLQGMS